MPTNHDFPEAAVIDAKQDALTILLRNLSHDVRAVAQQNQGIYESLSKVRDSTTRLESANTAFEISELKAQYGRLEARVNDLERDRTKRTGVREFAELIVKLWPLWMMFFAVFILYLKKDLPG